MNILLTELGEITVRSLISIIALFIVAKIIGPRQIAQLTFYDYILGITVGSIAAAVAIDTTLPLWGGVLALAIYCIASVAMAYGGSKSILCRRFFTGKPEILLYKGTFIEENLKKNKLDMTDITGICRANGYFNINNLEFIIIETNGALSFLPKSENAPLTPKDMDIQPSKAELSANIIIDGKIMENHLASIGKDQGWLKTVLQNEQVKLENILLATADESGNFKIYQKDQRPHHTDLFD